MKKLFITLLTLAGLAVGAKAQEMNETIVADAEITEIDSIATDTMIANPDSDPAPIIYDSIMARHRALRRATANCPIDSVRTYDVNGVLTSVTIYEYGDTIRAIEWIINVDGSRVGKSKIEYANDGVTFYGATFDWNQTANDWKGVSRADTVFNDAHQKKEITIYDWVNGDWSAKTQYTWKYDATYTNQETEALTYRRNSSNQLVLSEGRYREYNTAGRTTLDINYTTYNGTNWSAGTKYVYNFDSNGNQTEKTYYDSYNGTEWHKSSYEESKYETINNANKQTYYQKEEWKTKNNNTVWSVTSKKIWEYNAKAAQTLYEEYAYSTSKKDTLLITRNISKKDELNRDTLVENYTYNASTGAIKKSSKIGYTYWNSTTKKTSTIAYKWTGSAWVKNTKKVTDYDDAGNTKEACDYNWTNDAWIGTGDRTLTTYNSAKNPTEVITQTWPTNATDWVNSARTATTYENNTNPTEVINQKWSTTEGKWINQTRKTTAYSGGKTTQEAEYEWSTEIDNWVGTKRSDWHYNAAGKNDTIMTFTPSGTDWIYFELTANDYNAAGTNIKTYKASWDAEQSKWVMTSMTRTDIIDETKDGIRQTLNASWKCGSDTVWMGQVKDSASYTASGKPLFRLHCQAWKNSKWEPQYKIEYEYDESGNLLYQQQFDWNAAWMGHYRYEWGYDEAGRQTTYATYNTWNDTKNSWIGTTKTETVYDSKGQSSASIRYTWNTNTDEWDYLQKTVYTRDERNRVTQSILLLYVGNGEWNNSTKTEMAYIGNTTNLSKENKFEWANDEWRFNSRDESYYDDDAQAKLRREIKGTWNQGTQLSFSDKYYNYSCDPKACVVTFKNYDGTSLQSGEVAYGATPEYTGETPTKPADVQYTYSFAGWDKALVAVTAAATYTAQFTGTVNEYTITFKNGADTLQTGKVPYGTVPEYTGETPTKQGDVQYSYTFKGWDVEPAAVTGEATYTATFNSSLNEYTIIFKNGEDTLQTGKVAYGTIPTYDGAEPTKPADVQYSYTFKGWDVEPVAVTGEATYTATFSSTLNEYTIIFKNGEDTLQTGKVAYGTVPTYDGETPTKQGDVQYSYTFKGWDVEPVAVTGEATYTATFSSTLNEYTIIFKNGEDTLQTGKVAYGTVPTYDGAEPTKPADVQYSYTFKGWDVEPVAVTGEATYTATFSSTLNEYTITFKNGEDILQSSMVAYGTVPTYNGADPTKPATAQYTFVFKGWDTEIVPVSGDATYTARYDSIVNTYTITFYYEDGVTEIERVTVAYGETPSPEYVPNIPGDKQYTYVFVGWSPEIVPVTGDASYTAVFDKILRQYTITFKNYNGKELQRSLVDYGAMPDYTGETPTRKETTQYTYEFAGWSPELTEVTGDATYTAAYTAKPKAQGLDDVEAGSQATKILLNGKIYILRSGHTYTLDGTLVE